MKSALEKLEGATLPANENGCRIFTGSPSATYPQIRINGSLISVHRASYTIYVGPIPEGRSVLHSCDVKRCIEASHLHTGTPAENSAEMVARSRQSRRHGSKNTQAKLTDKKIKTIRTLHAQGWTQDRLAKTFNVAQGQISRIVRGLAWAHI